MTFLVNYERLTPVFLLPLHETFLNNFKSEMDPFGRTDNLNQDMLEALVVRFEARGKHALFSQMLHEYLDAMGVDGAGYILDLGCGTGLAARAIVNRARFSGKVVGIDISPYLLETARRLACEEGIFEQIEFRTGDARNLDFPDETFDAAVVHTLLSHVETPLDVLKEVTRVVKRGGKVGVFDGDYASLTFDHTDPVKGKAYDETLIRAVVTNPRVMRQMPRMLRAVGLDLVTSYSYVLSEAGTANFWSSAIEAYRRLIPKAGEMSVEEADAWASALRRDSEEGVFFGSTNYFAYVARRP